MERFFVGKSESINPENKGVINVRDLLAGLMLEDVSVAIVELDGVNQKVINKVSKVFYFVLEGEGAFNIDGAEHEVKEGDYVLINPGTPYFDKGKMKLLAVDVPKFNPNDLQHF